MARSRERRVVLLRSTLIGIHLARGLDLRIDAHGVESEFVHTLLNLGPGFEEREHRFAPSAALVPKSNGSNMGQAWGLCSYAVTYGAVKPCMC